MPRAPVIAEPSRSGEVLRPAYSTTTEPGRGRLPVWTTPDKTVLLMTAAFTRAPVTTNIPTIISTAAEAARRFRPRYNEPSSTVTICAPSHHGNDEAYHDAQHCFLRHSTQDKALRLFVTLLGPGEHPP